jgi:hypothetical protein
MKSPLKRTSPQGFHVLSRGFIPANPEWLSRYKSFNSVISVFSVVEKILVQKASI